MPTFPISATTLRTEYLENPLGIDTIQPALGWQILAGSRNIRQSGYQVQASKNPVRFEPGDLLWDSGKVASDQTQGIRYAGEKLASGQRVTWRVRAWDQDGHPSDWSQPAWWEIGLLDEKEWAADWIEVSWEEDPKAFKPCPYFRRNFTVDSPVRSARLYITAHGLYEAWLNGQRVGDQIFTPGYTPYDRMLQYQVYDVAPILQTGENVLGAILGDGWYRGKVSGLSLRNVYGKRLGLLAMLIVETAQGRQVLVRTDAEWKAATGPILKSDMKDGEIYDARLEMPGWHSVGFDDRAWKAVRVVQHPKNILVASMGVPVRCKETFHPQILKTPNGETVLDFGQNLAGVVHFKVQGPAGTTIRLRHGEALDKEGNFTITHLISNSDPEKKPFQQVSYTLKGEGVEQYEPRFTVHGFRYALLEGYPGEPKPEDFYSVAIYSDMQPTGLFECSNPLINQLHRNTIWSMKSNFLDLPTDCPQRERAGWTGDAQIFTPSAAFLMDTRAFFSKWLRELRIEQRADGRMGNFVPNPLRFKKNILDGFEGSAGWGDVAVLMPWYLYQAYGERQILEDQYGSMKAWVEYMRARARHQHWSKSFDVKFLFDEQRRLRQHLIWDTNYHWGEWLEPGDGSPLPNLIGIIRRLFFGCPVVATAYYAYSTHLLAQVADLLGRSDDAARYHALAKDIKAAYIAEFIRPDGRMIPDRQATYVRVLAFDLATEELKPLIIDHLVRLVKASGNHIGTGFLSTPFMLKILSETGHRDLAYAILLQEDYPSWLYAINKGATTIWENWDGVSGAGVPTASQNHYSKGAVASWFYEYICGIQLDPAIPGYKHFFLRPQPGGGFQYARASYNSIQGEIHSEWESLGSKMKYRFTVPPNTSATVTLEGDLEISQTEVVSNVHRSENRVSFDLLSGSYEFFVNPIQAG